MTEHSRLETPGGRIRAAREARQISLAEMSERTKIPPPVLEAIERDEYHKVSGALYIKSFLRTCAVEVGIEAEEILALYGGFSGEVKQAPGGPDMVWQDEEVQITRVGLPWRGITLTGLGLIIAGAVVLVLMRGCEAKVVDPATTGERVDVPVAAPGTAVAGAESVVEPVDSSVESPVESPAKWPAASGRDTLAWASQQAERSAVPQPNTQSNTRPAAQTAALPLPLAGGPGLVFAGGRQMNVVLRVMCEQPVGVHVKCDAEESFASAKWPAPGASAPPLPATGVEPGRVYAVSRGLVVYWGADDHLSLRLDRTDGVEVALNGKAHDVRNLRPGGELLLDAHGD